MAGYNNMWEVVTIQTFLEYDGNGQPSYLPEVKSRAQINRKIKRTNDQSGADIISMAQVTLPAGKAIKINDLVTTPGDPARLVQTITNVKAPYNVKTQTVAWL